MLGTRYWRLFEGFVLETRNAVHNKMDGIYCNGVMSDGKVCMSTRCRGEKIVGKAEMDGSRGCVGLLLVCLC